MSLDRLWFKQEVMYGLSARTKKSGRCREVAVVERWPLVEVRLYFSSFDFDCDWLDVCFYRTLLRMSYLHRLHFAEYLMSLQHGMVGSFSGVES